MLKYDEDFGTYILDMDGVTFNWDDAPQGDFEEAAKRVAASYRKQLPKIIAFMLPSLKCAYGDIDAEEAARKIGIPTINLDSGEVAYCEQRFDDIHIFCFEFNGEDFDELDNFAIDG